MEAIMDLFVPCPEFHEITGRQCEQERGHRNRGLPHVYTTTRDDDIWPVWWDENGDLHIPGFVICPVKKCPEVNLVHPISPDTALMDMMYHFQNEHPEMDQVELLDAIIWDERGMDE